MPLAPSRLLSASRTVKTFPRAAYFDGSGGYVEVPDSPLFQSSPFTVVVFGVNTNPGVRSYARWVGKGDGFILYGGWHVHLGSMSIACWWNDGSNRDSLYFSGNPSLWSMLTFVYNYPSIKVCYNTQCWSKTTGVATKFAPGYNLRLGRSYADYPTQFLEGYIPMALYYTRALSDSEIQQIYSNPYDPPSDGLVLWFDWTSLDCNAGKWYDKSGYGNNGTLYNVQCVDLIKKPVRILQPVR